ncbi:DUF6082 family protein [Dactylosporangium sp. CA-052675]|uniref:DUF6082 family protein n=1 Tax=Dactylosporangium sp. CA-052675 TaxID=3239927 RepID=UPI003D8A4812
MVRGRRLALAGLLLLVVAFVVLSPALMVAAAGYPLPWQRLGDVGQAYGAVSAIISALALLGVAVSLVIQQRQHRMTEEQFVRQRHAELVRLTLDNDKYLFSWGEVPPPGYDTALLGFSNLIVSYWLMLWRIGNIDETTLRRNARRLFNGQVGRDQWRLGGPDWTTPDGRSARFVAIMDEELQAAVAGGPPTSVPPRSGPPPSEPLPVAPSVGVRTGRAGPAVGLFALGAGLATGLAAVAVLVRRRRPRTRARTGASPSA